MLNWPLVKYTLTAAVRDRIILTLLVLVIVGISLSIFLASSAISEQIKFSMVFAGAGLRILGVIGLTLFVATYIRRSFDSKDVDFLLSRPIGRTAFIFSSALSFGFLAVFLGGLILMALLISIPNAVNSPGIWLWGASVIVEFVIMVNVALFFAMVLPSAAGAALAILAFYVLARMIGQLLGIVQAGADGPLFQILSQAMNVVSMIVPRLDLMGQTSWLVYEPKPGIGLGFVFAQGVFFSVLVLCAALVDLLRRQF